jgi:hypothetical protein
MLPVIVPIVQAKVLGAVALSGILVAVLLQIATEDGTPVMTGLGFTVTVIVYGAPAQVPVVEVGVTIYSTVPAVLLPGLVSTWLIVPPAPALAPVMPPLIAPTDQLKVHVTAVEGFVTAGVGLTVTVTIYAALAGQLPVVEVGITKYSTVPAVELLGLISVCAMVLPLPAVAPVIPPVMVPIVHANVLGAVAVNGILVAVLLQIATVAGTPVIAGVGLTVTVIV